MQLGMQLGTRLVVSIMWLGVGLGAACSDGGHAGPDMAMSPQPWVAPTGPWPSCTAVTASETLSDKARYYDWAAIKLHETPVGLRDRTLVSDVTLASAGPTNIVPDSALPTSTYHHADNAGLWTSLYVASQAFRYASTRDAEALDNLRRALRGTHDQMRVTGVPGLYARDLRDPTLPGVDCPTDTASYIPPGADRVGNRWVKLDAAGCAQTWGPSANSGAGAWVTSTHCVGTEFAGRCWQRNVSKDEYSGHMFAAGVAARLVDDQEVQTLAHDILSEVGHHLIDHAFAITDYDGLRTHYGSAYALAGDEFPGFNALLALSWMRAAATVTGEPTFDTTYHGCLLQEGGAHDCIDQPTESAADYRTYMDQLLGLSLGCATNYDNVSMAMLAYLNLIWFEPDPALRKTYRDLFTKETRGVKSAGRDLWLDANPFFNFILVAAMEGTDPAAAQTLVQDGTCGLTRFPADLLQHAHDNSAVAEGSCSGSAAQPISIENRCHWTFVWWNDPYEKRSCTEAPTEATQPAAFLLPYWMGRYFGYLQAGQ